MLACRIYQDTARTHQQCCRMDAAFSFAKGGVMTCDEYKAMVIQLLKSGDDDILEAAAACVMYCSENAIEPSDQIDERLGVLDNGDSFSEGYE